MAIMLDIGPSNPNIWWVFFLNMVISAYIMHEYVHIHYLNNKKFAKSMYKPKNCLKWQKNAQNAHSGPLRGPPEWFFFQDIGMSAYVIHKCIHIHYLNKEKFAQIELIAQKQPKTVKNDKKMPKMLIPGLGGTLCAYFMVMKPPSSFSSHKMDMVGGFLH